MSDTDNDMQQDADDESSQEHPRDLASEDEAADDLAPGDSDDHGDSDDRGGSEDQVSTPDPGSGGGAATMLSVLVPLAIIAGLLALAIVLLLGRDEAESPGQNATSASSATVAPSTAVQNPDNSSPPAAVGSAEAVAAEASAIEPDVDLPVRSKGVIETFTDGDADGLGETDNGRNWGEVAGQWEVRQGAAVLVTDPSIRSIAVVDSGVANGVITIESVVTKAKAGIVFRYVDKDNYWMLTAVPTAGTWNVRKVVTGEVVDVANLGTASTGNGDLLSIELRGAEIGIGVNGVGKVKFTDETHLDGTGVGLTATGDGATEAVWDNLVVTSDLFYGFG